MVVQADGTEIDLLAKEGILEMDAFVAVTSDDEKNIISCLLARHLGIQKTISLVNKIDYMPLMPVIGIDSTVNVRLSTANAILRLIRRGHILSVVSFHGIEAEGIEFEIKEKGKITDKPLSKIKLPEGSVIAFIVRHGESFVPHGNSVIKQGDRVIVFALPQAVPELERKFS
jgi:trk system potassium uptake protein TrkA